MAAPPSTGDRSNSSNRPSPSVKELVGDALGGTTRDLATLAQTIAPSVPKMLHEFRPSENDKFLSSFYVTVCIL
ncbi:hypothetical protein HBI16_211120 [Parastagonospora nodorum]|nr:hypothetical protein HBI79_022190 [Parastagonospora nodorum]KAH5757127.1 hypothetical protein HBI16_211120 [Parastagonospora nodorum]